jgi:hypothetical protein
MSKQSAGSATAASDAVISLQLTLPLLKNESARALRQRVREEALRYLDIA